MSSSKEGNKRGRLLLTLFSFVTFCKPLPKEMKRADRSTRMNQLGGELEAPVTLRSAPFQFWEGSTFPMQMSWHGSGHFMALDTWSRCECGGAMNDSNGRQRRARNDKLTSLVATITLPCFSS